MEWGKEAWSALEPGLAAWALCLMVWLRPLVPVLFFNVVDPLLGWDSKTHASSTISAGDRKVTLSNNVHADQNVRVVTKVRQGRSDADNINTVANAEIDQVNIGFKLAVRRFA